MLIFMSKKELEIYERPFATVAFIEVESGFAISESAGDGWGDSVDPYEPVTPPGGEDLFPED